MLAGLVAGNAYAVVAPFAACHLRIFRGELVAAWAGGSRIRTTLAPLDIDHEAHCLEVGGIHAGVVTAEVVNDLIRTQLVPEIAVGNSMGWRSVAVKIELAVAAIPHPVFVPPPALPGTLIDAGKWIFEERIATSERHAGPESVGIVLIEEPFCVFRDMIGHVELLHGSSTAPGDSQSRGGFFAFGLGNKKGPTEVRPFPFKVRNLGVGRFFRH